MIDFVTLCKMKQPTLKTLLIARLTESGYAPIAADGFIYAAQQNCPILLTAHLDTVHEEIVRDVFDDGFTVTSPQGIGGDDRCGVYIILSLLDKTEIRPAILFCEDEEAGGIGSNKFCKRNDLVEDVSSLKFMIELDRMHANDAVFYDDDNADFHDFIREITGYVMDWGSFSDISHLMPATGISGVNLSCGYYNPHTKQEYVVYAEMENTVAAVQKLCEEAKKESCARYEFMQRKFDWMNWRYGYDYEDDRHYLAIQFIRWNEDNTEVEEEAEYDCMDINDGFVQFFKENPETCWNDVLDYQYI